MKRRHAVPLVAALAAVTIPSVAAARDETIREPGEHPDYHFDIEPHGVLGLDFYGDGGLGLGGGIRISMPVCKNCFIPKINNNVAVTFGADFAFFPFFDNPGYAPWYLYLPVAMQWNFFVAKKWSVAAEPGIVPWFGLYDYGACNGCHNWAIWPSLSFVGRYHFNDRVALTMRVGIPEFFNIGVSFWL